MENLKRVALLLLGVIATAIPGSAFAQEFSSAELDEWFDIATIYNFSDRFRYDGDYGIRSLASTRGFTQLYLRPSVRYRVKPWFLVHGGIAWFYSNFDDRDNVNELRPWGGLRFLGPQPGGFAFSNYLRLEYRAFHFKDQNNSEQVWRGRYQLQVTSPGFKIGRVRGFRGVVFVEPFKTFGTEVEGLFINQFRFNVGIGKKVSQNLRIEFNYMFQKVRLEEQGSRLKANDHILRLRLFYSLNRK